jgi:hypothetical protein
MTTTTAKCKRCHRTLSDPASVARGYGRTCAAKVAANVTAAVAPFTQPQVDKALALIAGGGLVTSGTDSFYLARGAYRTDATLCTCPAGQHGRTCYHLIAARVLDAVAAA